MAKVQPRAIVVTLLARLALTGFTALACLAVVAIVGVALNSWQLLGLAATFMILILGVIAVDTNRQARRNALRLRRGVGLAPSATVELPTKAAPTHGDPVGLAKLLQAQYVGRLDRAQASFERATTILTTQAASESSPSHPLSPDAQAPLTVHRLGEDVIPVIRTASAAGISIQLQTDDVASARACLAEAGLAGAVTFLDAPHDPPAVTLTLVP